MGIKHKVRAFALGAVSAALGAIFLTAGFYLQLGEFIFFLLACIPAMSLLHERRYALYCLSIAASCCISLIFTGFSFIYLFPFVVLFAHYPMTRLAVEALKVKKAVKVLIKLAVFELGLYLTWRFTEAFISPVELIEKFMLPILLLIGIPVCLMYDEVIRRIAILIGRLTDKLTKR